MIGGGKAHVHTLVSMAQSQFMDALNSGADIPETIQSFASLGGWGAHSQNEERDLHRWLKNLHQISLEPYFLKLKLEVGMHKGHFLISQNAYAI